MTTQAPIDPRHEQGQQKVARVEVYWRAVTYKTVVGYSCLGVAILFGGFYLAKPDWYSFVYKKFTNAVNNAVSNSDPELAGTDQKKAKFVNLDGKVEVKKVDSVKWADADFNFAVKDDEFCLFLVGPCKFRVTIAHRVVHGVSEFLVDEGVPIGLGQIESPE